MKLLLDQNVSRKLVWDMEIRFPGTSHVALLGLDHSDDSDIWYYARHHAYTLVTKNTDMVDLCVLRGAPPFVVWLRIGNCTTTRAEFVLRNVAPRVHAFLASGEESCLVLAHPRVG